MSNILIIGAAGQIPHYLIPKLIDQEHHVVLFAREAEKRLSTYSHDQQVTLMNGDLKDVSTLKEALKNIDIVYTNTLSDTSQAEPIIEAMTNTGVQQLIAASVLDIHDEVVGPFKQWNLNMVGSGLKLRVDAANTIFRSGLDYTVLRLTWLYNQEGKAYEITHKNEPFTGTQVTRQAVAQLISDIINQPESYSHESIGVNEPNTNFNKPSFY